MQLLDSISSIGAHVSFRLKAEATSGEKGLPRGFRLQAEVNATPVGA
jgi:hypothetical protein